MAAKLCNKRLEDLTNLVDFKGRLNLDFVCFTLCLLSRGSCGKSFNHSRPVESLIDTRQCKEVVFKSRFL